MTQKRKKTPEQLNEITPEYIEQLGERGSELQSVILEWRRLIEALWERTAVRMEANDSLVKYNPITGKGMILCTLLQEDSLTQAEIARRVGNRPQTIGVHIKNLIAEGTIQRQPDDRDKRAFRIALTEKGRTAAELLQKKSDQSGSMFEALTLEELVSFKSSISKIANRLEEECQTAAQYDALVVNSKADQENGETSHDF